MIFLTEDDIRARAPQSGGLLSLAPSERLTPAAAEYASQLRLRIEQGGPGDSVPRKTVGQPSRAQRAKTAGNGQAAGQAAGQPDCSQADCSQEMTYLDQDALVAKSHPSIIMRGKLDTLLSAAVLAQTQFDPKNRLPGLLKQSLAELGEWILQTLAAEVGGTAFTPKGMAGMDGEVLRQVSREPGKYLGIEHFAADPSMGGNIALLNWLRALARETEVTAVACSANLDVVRSLNRLSSALYVLMLLTLAAERGQEIIRPKD